jgi:DNA-binding response OmpR family regulator
MGRTGPPAAAIVDAGNDQLHKRRKTPHQEWSKRTQELQPGLRVLYMTGYSRNAVVHHGGLDEGVELLEKPITQAALAMRVRAVLDRSAIRNY